MDHLKKRRLLFGAATVTYAILVSVFYWKYVPLVAGYQVALAPLLLIVTIVTAIDVRRGLLAFIFLFPLINNLPYFFKLYEPLPMAPSALVLFLFFFLGWLLHRTFAAPDPAGEGEKPSESIFTPLRLFTALVAVSALITFWRYTNFFPLWRPRVYELVTNAFGTSAGGALMSVVFYSLTYLTGIAFFAILVRAVRSEAFIRKAITILGASTLLSVGFGLIQHFHSLTLGNNPLSIQQGLLNATFKDALSFGAFLSMSIPFFLGILFSLKGRSRLILSLTIIPSGFLLFYAGSKSGLISFLAALLALALFALGTFLKHGYFTAKKFLSVALAVLVLAGASTIIFSPKISPLPSLRKSTTIVRMNSFQRAIANRLDNHWTIAGRIIQGYPLSGLGMGSFIIESSNIAKKYAPKYEHPESAENLLLQIGSELGIPGILLFLWVLWKILGRGVHSYRAGPPSSFNRALVPAAAAGLISFLLNTLTHSYIGSNEIHYVFWFLAAMLFSAAASPLPSSKTAAFRSPVLRFSALALIFISGLSLLWSSTHSLSLNEQTRRYGLRQEFGLGPGEKNNEGIEFRWSGRFAGIPYQIDAPRIDIPLLVSHPDISVRPVRIKIFVAADLATKPKLIREIILKESRWETIKLSVPDGIRGSALLLFEVDRTWNPRKEGVSADLRNLGVAIGIIKSSG
ncbi:MAG: O-antigen ligase family protein [Candidatus Aminicenantes bacterium]|nr:O-antigen ligase family protein [Candidatus Aminicenantes bacterium]